MTLTAGSPRPKTLLGLASAGVLLAAADTYVVVLALPDMMAGVGLGIESIQRATPIISGFLLGYVAVLPLVGRLADLLDRRRILLSCLAIFVVGSVVTALAVELPVLVTGRVLQGLGGGGLVPATLALVADLWPRERRGTPLGVVGAVQELGAVLGPVLGALVLAVSGWRAIFWLNAALGTLLYAALRLLGGPAGSSPGHGVPVGRVSLRRWAVRGLAGVVAALGVLTLWAPDRLVTSVSLGVPFVPFDAATGGTSRVLTPIGLVTGLGLVALALLTATDWAPVVRRADGPGAALVALALGCLVLTFSTADPERDVVGPAGVALLPVGAVAVLLFLWRQRRLGATTSSTQPLVPAGVVRGHGWRADLVSLFVGAALVAVLVDVPLLARLTLTDSQTTAALVLVRFLVAVPVGALLGGLLLRRVGTAAVASTGLLGAAVGLVLMTRWEGDALTDRLPTTGVLVLVGLGLGLALAPVNAAALDDAPPDAHGVASALVVVARMIGMVVGLALLTAVGLHRYYGAVAALPDQGDAAALLDTALVQVHTVFAGGAVAAALAAVVALGLGGRPDGSTETVGTDGLSEPRPAVAPVAGPEIRP